MKSDCHLSAWLFKIAVCACENAIRIESRKRRKEAKIEAEMTTCESRDSLARFEARDILIESLRSLSESDRNAILMRYADDLSLSEISEALRISAPAASQRISRAIEKLRRFFAKNGAVLAVDALSGMLVPPPHSAPEVSVALAQIHAAIGQAGSSAHVIAISQGVIHQMKILKLKLAASIALGCGAFVGGTVGAISYAFPQQSVTPIPTPAAVASWPSSTPPTVADLLAAWGKADRIKSCQVNETLKGYETSDISEYNRVHGKLVVTRHTSDVNGNPVKEISLILGYSGRINQAKSTIIKISEPGYYLQANQLDINSVSISLVTLPTGDETVQRYKRLSGCLSVSASEVIDNRTCYALKIDRSKAGKIDPKFRELPDTIWFSYVAPSTLAPVRTRTIPKPEDPAGDVVFSTYSNYELINNRYVLPCHILSTPGLADYRWKVQNDLKWSHINENIAIQDQNNPK
jgi:hypothetical protein